MEQFNRNQKPYVKCITKEEYNTNKDKLKNNEIINIDNKQNNPVTKTGGLYCLAKNNSFVHICKVNTIHSDNTSIELQPLMEINWEQWINFGGQRKVTKQGNLQNYKEFVEEIHSILPQINRIERVELVVTDTEVIDNEVTENEVSEVTENEVTEVTENEVTEVSEVTENEVSEDNKQLFEEMKEELVKANKNITTLTNKINKLTSTIQKTDQKTIQKTNQETNKKEKPNYSLRNTIIFFMPLIIAGIYKYNTDLQFFNITL